MPERDADVRDHWGVSLSMTASAIEEHATSAGLAVPPDVVVEIDERDDLRGRGLYGYTWPDGHKVTLYPDAFQDGEQLLRTLVHELVHVRQVRDAGPSTDSVELAAREAEAYAEEEAWWKSYRERR